MTYRLSYNHRKEPGIETELPVRKATKRDREEEKEGGKRTEKSVCHRDAPGAGGKRSAKQGAKLNGRGTVFDRPVPKSGGSVTRSLSFSRVTGRAASCLHAQFLGE